jgi:hypothetical protein
MNAMDFRPSMLQQVLKHTLFAIAASLLLVLQSSATDNDTERSPLDQPSFLMVDPRVVERASELELQLGTTTKSLQNPLIVEDRPWEVRFDNVYPNVIFDSEFRQFKCFYSPFIVDENVASTPASQQSTVRYRVTPSREMGLCYATSRDGLKWERPDLGIVSFDGSSRNNILMRGVHGASVIYDVDANNPGEKYKLLAGHEVPGDKRYMVMSTSSDGIKWSTRKACPSIESEGDTHNELIWAPTLQKYVGFTREMRDQRLVTRTESDTFQYWTKAVEVLRGTPESQTYSIQVFPCGGIYVGLLSMLDVKTDRVRAELAVSRDTIEWQRICPGQPFIDNSQNIGEYDYGCVYCAAPVRVGDEELVYYGASDAPHSGWRKGSLGLATLKKGRWAGFAHVAGDNQPESKNSGTIVTAKLVCRGAKLQVNALSHGGAIRVGVVGQKELSTASCTPISGDVVDHTVEWTNGRDLAEFLGKSIQLEFRIQEGTLYEFSFADR